LDILELFKEPYLKYTYPVEILVGNKKELEHARDRLQSKLQSLAEEVEIISFDIDTWQASSA
jgi:prefoldin subunit 5